jgi:uncharacterized membrane protein
MIGKAGISADGDSKDQSLRERLDPSRTDKGGAAGTAVDKLLSKGGWPGRAMAKLSLGSRITERLRGSGSDAGAEGSAAEDETPASAPVPIQEAVTVAVPVALAYRLCLRLEDYPAFLDRVKEVEVSDDEHAEFSARIRGTDHRIAVEIFDRWENQRIDWRSPGEVEHSGVISFHELAPRLTYVDLSVDVEPRGPLQRLARATHLSDRTVRTELQRFKAYAELYEDEGDAEVYAEAAEAPDEEELAGDREEPEPDEEEEK